MVGKFLIASLLLTASAAGSGQGARSAADSSTAQWPHMHQCTLTPASRLAIKTKGTSAKRIAVGDLDGDGWSQIDLHLAGSPDGSGGPTISAHAINTKGTGANTGRTAHAINTKGTGTSGRMTGSDYQGRVEVACVSSPLAGEEAARTAAAQHAFLSADGNGVGWSCSVSGSEDKPVFRIGLLVPTILGQAESPLGKAATWSWGVSNSRVSIVSRSAEHSDNWHVACASTEPRRMNYDLAVMKKV